MKVEKEVTICVESFIDALEIVDKMNVSLPHAVIFMDEEEFLEGKCRVVIDKTLFMFFPVHKLFKDEKVSCREVKYKLIRYIHEWDDPVYLGKFDSIDEAKKAGRADMDKVFSGRWFTTMEEWKETPYGLKNEAIRGDDDYIYIIEEKEE